MKIQIQFWKPVRWNMDICNSPPEILSSPKDKFTYSYKNEVPIIDIIY